MTAEIVIAEDDETTREVVEFNLTENGWDVVAFTDGDECWEQFRQASNAPVKVATKVFDAQV